MVACQRRRMFCVSLVMWSVALLAGYCDVSVRRHAQRVQNLVTQALRYAALDILEAAEVWQAKKTIVKDEHDAIVYEVEAEKFEERADAEHDEAKQDRKRGDYLDAIAQWQTLEVGNLMARASMDDRKRQILLDRIDAQLATQDEKEQFETAMGEGGACNIWALGPLCDALGNIVPLDQVTDATALQIHDEWHAAVVSGREEAMDIMVASMLQGQAQQYESAAVDLTLLAEAWDEQAQQDYERAAIDSVVAREWEQEAVDAHSEEEYVEHEQAETVRVAHQLLLQAEWDRTAANQYALAGLLLSALASVFFSARAMRRLVYVVGGALGRSASSSSTRDNGGPYRILSHAIVFLLSVRHVGSAWLHMQDYDVRQRAVVLLCFAAMAASLQVFLVHLCPLAVVHYQTTEWPHALLQLAKKWLALFVRFLLEELLAWLWLGSLLFSATAVGILSTWYFCVGALVVLLFCTAQLVLLQQDALADDDASCTVCTSVDDASYTSDWVERNQEGDKIAEAITRSSETTPLVADINEKTDLIPNGSSIGIHPPTFTTASSLTASWTPARRFQFSSGQEFRQLLLLLEVLVVSCMASVVWNCFHVVWHSQGSLIQLLLLVCVYILLMMGVLLAQYWTCDGGNKTSEDGGSSATRHSDCQMVNV